MDGMTESEPTLSSACCASPGPYRPIKHSGLLGEFRIESKAGHSTGSPTHDSTDINWPRLLPSTGPSQSGVSYIERRSVSNPGSHYRESSTLPTELRDGQMLLTIMMINKICSSYFKSNHNALKVVTSFVWP